MASTYPNKNWRIILTSNAIFLVTMLEDLFWSQVKLTFKNT